MSSGTSPSSTTTQVDSEKLGSSKSLATLEPDCSSNTLSVSLETRETLTTPVSEQVLLAKSPKWFLAYFAVITSVLLFALDATIVADIQPQIIEAFREIDKLPWIAVAFSLGTIAILPQGKANGLFDVKWLFAASVIAFEVGSILCGAAPNMTAMIIGRAISGVGGAGIYCGGLTFISVTTNERERPLYLSGIAVVWGLGSVLGPLVGGALAQSSATWRWAFYINPVVAAVLAPALLFCMPSIVLTDIPFSQKLRNTDWAGMVIFCGGSICYTMAITFGGSVYSFDSSREIVLWVLTGIFLLTFIAVTRFHPGVSAKDRLYPSHFVRSLELNNLQLQLFLAAGGMMTTIYYTPLLFQFTRGDGALQAGIRLLPLICMIVFFSIANAGIMPIHGYYMPWYVFGNAMTLTGSALMYTSDSNTTTSRIYGSTALIGMGIGSSITAGFAVVQALVPPQEVSNAVGFMSIGQSLGQISILAIAGTVFQNIGAEKLQALLPGTTQAEALQLLAGTSSASFQSLSGELHDQVIEQITLAISNVFAIVMAASALGLVFSIFLSRKRIYH